MSKLSDVISMFLDDWVFNRKERIRLNELQAYKDRLRQEAIAAEQQFLNGKITKEDYMKIAAKARILYD